MDDNILTNAAKKGNLDAFNDLVLKYQDAIYNLAYRIMGDSDSAADAAQNAFISAYKNIHRFRGGSFKSWMFRIVTNKCYDELRKIKRHPVTSLEPQIDNNSDETFDSPYWLKDPGSSPEDSINEADLHKAIENCIKKLPDNFKAVLVLIEMEDMDYQQVADSIDVPIGTIKSRLARARQRMQKCLQYFRELLPEKFRLDGEEFE